MKRYSFFRISPARALLSAMLLLAAALPEQAEARYWELVCKGPIAGITANGRNLVLEARAGWQADRPRAGECVWRDRGMNRPGEHVSGRIRLVLPTRARITGMRRMRNGTLSFFMPGHGDIAELAGLLFSTTASPVILHARRTGQGRYAIRLAPSVPGVSARPAPPAPSAIPAPRR